ncbi:hypothetical protein F4677DRAFT_456313 [Hypoxylon crocopeplum]|nr:hypothetical protein F4677DRAFT_456313 [Hypoxylon crocopeplum]
MSGLEASGIACNIMQVIGFAHETVDFCRAIYQGQSFNEYSEQNAASLSALSAQLQIHFQTATLQTAEDKELAKLAEKCNIAARALEEEVKFLISRNNNGNLAQTLRIAVKTMWRKGRLERLEKSLHNHQSTTESYLLARVCKQSDAIELQQRQGFEQLGKDVQFFISQYAIGHTKLIDLVKIELTSVKDHATNEILRSEESVRMHISLVRCRTVEKSITSHVTENANQITQGIAQISIESKIQATTKEQQNRLLQSLRFPDMNERKNGIAESHEGTYRWIFRANYISEEDNLTESDSDTTRSTWSTTSDDSSKDCEECWEDKPWDDFEDWLKSDSDIYWISGKPGSGKSTLMKYLIESPHTQAALDIWGKDSVIFSHFFWKPGNIMQRNIKGFLCSVLHQALHLNMVVLDLILATSYKSLSTKDYPSSMCIFLDGLDEICQEDGPLSLMKLVDILRALPNVKICVASRPEPLLQSALYRHQQFRLQDLTRNDMWKYASAQILPYVSSGQIRPLFASDINKSLIDKAEGVFLWLHLATRSLIRGLETGDTEELLKQRLEEMPNDLSKLYFDMWNRMNEDTTLYRETAARYFNLMIASVSDIRLLYLMATANLEVQNSFISKRTTMDAASLEQLCIKTSHDIKRRCVGLLEIVQYRNELTRTWDPARYERLLPYGQMVVRFIHRTAYDFLMDTKEGHEIRRHDPSSPDTSLLFQFIKGDLVEAKLLRHFPCNNVFRIISPLSRLTGAISQTAIDEVLRAIWDWYDKGYYQVPSVKVGIPPPFLAVSARPAFKDFVLSSIMGSPNPSPLATDVLRNIASRGWLGSQNASKDIDTLTFFLTPLLALNADLSSMGICFQRDRGSLRGQPLPFHTPIGNFVLDVFQNDHLRRNISRIYKPLQIIVETRPDLRERIPLLIEIQESTFRVRILDDWDDSTQGLDISNDQGSIVTLILLDLDLVFLVRTLCEQARDLGHSSKLLSCVDEVLSQTPGATSRDTSSHIALFIFGMFSDRPGGLQARRYRPSSDPSGNEDMRKLLASLLQFLRDSLFEGMYGDLAQEANQQMTNILHDISNGSTEYEEVKKSARMFLAERNIGYCLVDETGATIPRGDDSEV